MDNKENMEIEIPRYKFGTHNKRDHKWFIMDTTTNIIVENIKDGKVHEIIEICAKWNAKVCKGVIHHTCKHFSYITGCKECNIKKFEQK